MQNQQRIQLLREAQDMLEMAVEKIIEATTNTPEEGRARAYIIPHLQDWVESTVQPGSIPSMIEGIGDEDDFETNALREMEAEREALFAAEMGDSGG